MRRAKYDAAQIIFSNRATAGQPGIEPPKDWRERALRREHPAATFFPEDVKGRQHASAEHPAKAICANWRRGDGSKVKDIETVNVCGGSDKSCVDDDWVVARTDMAAPPDVAARLATVLPADPVEIEGHLLDQHRAVLGVVPGSSKPYGAGVQWNPADHLCVTGELLAADPVGPR